MNIKDIHVGLKVKFKDKLSHKVTPKYYPPVGTIGTVIEIIAGSPIIKWEKGSTSGNDEWMADPDWIEPI